MDTLLPFLKWAGGKRWLATAFPDLATISYSRYIEPFLGSGAVFFWLAPTRAILSDSNADLIETYQAIKDDCLAVEQVLERHHWNHCESYYYAVRDSRPRAPHTRAARFIYLNRTCWNGLYRVNRQGRFNVPIGTKDDVLLDTDDFESVSRALRGADLRCSDFEKTMELAEEGDLVFVDPPYTVKHNLNGFVKYNESLFSWDDQVRLRDAVLRAKGRGATVIVSNANHQSIRDLYSGVGSQMVLTRSSVLAADSKKRGTSQELIIRC